MNLEELKLKKWYKSGNILFMPLEYSDDISLPRAFGRHPDKMVKMAYFQDASHMGIFDLSLLWWEVNLWEKREFLYHDESENVLEDRDIESATTSDFRVIIKAFFEAENWHTGSSTQYIKPHSKEGLNLMRSILKEV